jgi:hypothetical protein
MSLSWYWQLSTSLVCSQVMRRWLLTLKGDVGLGLEGVLRAPSDFVSVSVF